MTDLDSERSDKRIGFIMICIFFCQSLTFEIVGIKRQTSVPILTSTSFLLRK